MQYTYCFEPDMHTAYLSKEVLTWTAKSQLSKGVVHAGWGQGQVGIEPANNHYEQHITLSPGSSPGSTGDNVAHGSRQGPSVQSAGLGESSLLAITNMGSTDPESSTAAGTLAPAIVISQPAAAFGAAEQLPSNANGHSVSATSLPRPGVPVAAGQFWTKAVAMQSIDSKAGAVAATIAAARQTPAFASSVAAKMTGFRAGNSTPDLVSMLKEVIETLLPGVSYSVASLHNYGWPVVVLMFPDMVTAQWAELQIHGKQHGTMQLSLQLMPEAPLS